MTHATFQGLFKNAQMQGVQEPKRKAYYSYVERYGLQRNAADECIVKPPAFSGKEVVHL
jgi:hypothetical protein